MLIFLFIILPDDKLIPFPESHTNSIELIVSKFGIGRVWRDKFTKTEGAFSPLIVLRFCNYILASRNLKYCKGQAKH
jgi:hypothetical protein